MKQTLFLPPLKVQADKGTNVQRSRHVTTSVMVVPDSKNLLVNVYLRQPVVKANTANGLSTSIKGEIKRNCIKP